MFNNRLFALSIVIAVVAAIAFTTNSFLLTPERTYYESTDQILRDYDLGERFGDTTMDYAERKAQRDYWLGERLGVLPQDDFASVVLRDYWLGERFGVTSQNYTEKKAERDYWLGERMGVTH